MATSYEAIATVTVGSGGAANIEFTSIPGTYTDLCILASLRNEDAANGFFNVEVAFNGNSTGYSQRIVYNLDGAVGSASNTNIGHIRFFYGNNNGTTASTFSNGIIYIPNYASSNNKSVLLDSVTENNSSTGYIMGLTAGLWANSAPITSISLKAHTSVDIAQHSTATLYGIKNS